MAITSLCLMLSTLVIHPDRSQYFWYESINLTCGEAGNSDGWILKRNTSMYSDQLCNSDWGVSNESSCIIEDAYPSDNGVYWCESKLGNCSNTVNITVTGGGVILKSPALPVTEGDRVTLRCSDKEYQKKKAPTDYSANFYKDGIFIGTGSAGNLTFLKVSKSDEGFYKCEIPTKGESPQSWLAVKAAEVQPPPLMTVPRLVCAVLLVVIKVVMLIVCVKVNRDLAKARAESKKRASRER
ncbi:sialoadhesin-like isoform X1 [Anoplopoma fimbria]|uniref:sialoadhesin-like isoform X1 n=1 Tax=Anoplopoma fimbria TaxID=229290 RepID=UPI0023EE0252|nr:sialoadhesin-like isoform X1 [Anoplopoma fimbria]